MAGVQLGNLDLLPGQPWNEQLEGHCGQLRDLIIDECTRIFWNDVQVYPPSTSQTLSLVPKAAELRVLSFVHCVAISSICPAMDYHGDLRRLEVNRLHGQQTKIHNRWVEGAINLDVTVMNREGELVRHTGSADLVGVGARKFVYCLPHADVVVKKRYQAANDTEWSVFQHSRQSNLGCEHIAWCYGDVVLDRDHYTVMENVPLSAYEFMSQVSADIGNPSRVVDGLRVVKAFLSLLFDVLFRCNMIPWDFTTQNYGFKHGKLLCFDYDNWEQLKPDHPTGAKVYIWKVFDRLARDLPAFRIFSDPTTRCWQCLQDITSRVNNAKQDSSYL